jgi:hypothetical protein
MPVPTSPPQLPLHGRLIQEHVTLPVLLGLDPGIDIQDHNLSGVAAHCGPDRQARTIRVAGLDEVGEVFLHYLRYLIVVGRPGVYFVGAQIAHCVFDLG